MIAPTNSNEFCASVLEISKNLIEMRYWDTIDNVTLKKWLSNFKDENEKYFAAKILLSLRYRNEKAIISMVKHLIQVLLPTKLEELNIYSLQSLEQWETILSKKSALDLPFCFSAIKKSQSLHDSGGELFRLMQKQKLVHSKLGMPIDQIDHNKYKHIVIIDDFMGTGSQFSDFYNKNLQHFSHFQNIIYCPLVATKCALCSEENRLQNTHFLPVEVIDREDSLFGLSDTVNNNESFIEFYKDMMKSKKIKHNDLFGFGKLGLLYGFSISTPNNSLPILYKSDCDQWHHLLRR
jgi:hypothetical protein